DDCAHRGDALRHLQGRIGAQIWREAQLQQRRLFEDAGTAHDTVEEIAHGGGRLQRLDELVQFQIVVEPRPPRGEVLLEGGVGWKAAQEPLDHLALSRSSAHVRATCCEIAIEDLGMHRPADMAMQVRVVWPGADSSLLDHRDVVTSSSRGMGPYDEARPAAAGCERA